MNSKGRSVAVVGANGLSGSPLAHCMRLSYAYYSDEDIVEGVSRLWNAYRAYIGV